MKSSEFHVVSLHSGTFLMSHAGRYLLPDGTIVGGSMKDRLHDFPDESSADVFLDRWSQFDEGSGGARLIMNERRRQIVEEGYDATHDYQFHDEEELAFAAECYIRFDSPGEVPDQWPFDDEEWKPNPDDRIGQLVKAGALIAAEIDRQLRDEKHRQERERELMQKPRAFMAGDARGVFNPASGYYNFITEDGTVSKARNQSDFDDFQWLDPSEAIGA